MARNRSIKDLFRRVAWCLVGLDPDRLYIQMLIDVLLPAFTAIAAHLVAAKRHRRVRRLIAVDPDRSSPDAARKSVGLANIARPDSGAEPEMSLVRPFDHLLDVIERNG